MAPASAVAAATPHRGHDSEAAAAQRAILLGPQQATVSGAHGGVTMGRRRLRADRERRAQAARARWGERARDLRFGRLEKYLTHRRADGATAHRVRSELGCGGTVAVGLIGGSA